LKRAVDELRKILFEDVMGQKILIATHDAELNATIVEDAKD
jgi:hypothetical protein